MVKGMALRPNYFSDGLKESVETKVEPTLENNDDEKHLYALSKHKGWEVLREGIKTDLEVLENLNKQAISTGMSFEQVGYNSVVLNGIKDVVESLFNRVKDAVEAIEKSDGTDK